MDGPPEMVAGMVIKVMTSCSLRPARRARKPPMAWMPSWEFPAKRITASEIFFGIGLPSATAVVEVASLIALAQLFAPTKKGPIGPVLGQQLCFTTKDAITAA